MTHPADFQRPIRIPDNVELAIAEPHLAKAGDKSAWRLKFVLAQAIPKESNLFLYVHGRRNNRGVWEHLQADDPSKEGYLGLKRASGETLPLIEATSDGGLFTFQVPEAGLERGEQLTAELGGTAGAVAPKLSLPNKFFLLLAASPDEWPARSTLHGEALQSVVGACLIHIVGSQPAQLQAYAPSHALVGDEVSLLVRPEDQFGNVACEQPGDLVVQVDGHEVRTERASVQGSTCCLLRGIVLSQPGVYRLQVEDVSRGLRAVTNPIECSQEPPSRRPSAPLGMALGVAGGATLSLSKGRVLWGMIHGHTEISDGAGSLDHYFAYMRDECGLDFGATGDHDHLSETSDQMWQLTQQAVAKYDEPARFTTLLGYEWAKWRRNGDGDRNVYYPGDRGPLLRSDDECYPTPTDLFEALQGETALIIPHHTAEIGNHCDWKDHDPEKERLVEIYSRWGSSERSVHDGNPYPVQGKDRRRLDSGEVPVGFVQRALELGWRVGFTGGGDDHIGHAGDQVVAHDKPFNYKAGLMAVCGRDNTRQSLWDAMWNRQCYATTGARIIVDFHLDGHPMGSELVLAQHPELARARRINVSVHGTAPIRSVEIVRNNDDVYASAPDSLDAAFEWNDPQTLAEVNLPPALYCGQPFTFYYLRVTQADGEMAWASPIWILS